MKASVDPGAEEGVAKASGGDNDAEMAPAQGQKKFFPKKFGGIGQHD